MKCRKAAGTSGIVAKMLKSAIEEGVRLARQLTDVVERVVSLYSVSYSQSLASGPMYSSSPFKLEQEE